MISPILLKDTLQIILGNLNICELKPLRITCKLWNRVCNRIEQSRIQKATFLKDMSLSFIPLDDKYSVITSLDSGPVPDYTPDSGVNFDDTSIFNVTTDRKRKRTKTCIYYKNRKRNKLSDLQFIEFIRKGKPNHRDSIISSFDVHSGNCWILKTEDLKEYITESTEYRMEFVYVNK